MNAIKIRKMVLTAMFACLSFVLCTFVYFPSMAPFQHFVNVLAAVFLGPWYGLAAAFLTGVMRMMSGRTIQALIGAVFGAFLSGLLYQKTKKLWAAVVGEVIGTGIISAMVAYPLMKMWYGLDAQSPFYYIPFYTPSSMMGAFLAVLVPGVLKRSGMLQRLLDDINR
ncbi:energy coupling factor transporter S component ThiW [Oscillospiraceae bacterium LTW-04]|nr:energy coupling factor transporter S component ThiW [Oscillospiraceae bacterium MB24-C1]